LLTLHPDATPATLAPFQYEVQYILDSVTDALLLNPDRKFIEVEMYGPPHCPGPALSA